MELDKLIGIIDKLMKEKNSFLREIIFSKEPVIYLHEYEDLEEYKFLHTLAKCRILNEDCRSGRSYILFGTNSNTLEALNNPRIYFNGLKKKE